MTTRSGCESCGSELTCRNCDDNRPTAADLYAGWKLRTELGTWETVKRVAQKNEYAPVFVWTQERPDFAWEYTRYCKVDAVAPAIKINAAPEVRFLDSDGDMSMHVVAGVDTTRYGWTLAPSQGTFAMAAFAGRGKGWWIQAQRGNGERDEAARAQGLSKSEARAELKKIGREFAKRLKVKFTIQAAR